MKLKGVIEGPKTAKLAGVFVRPMLQFAALIRTTDLGCRPRSKP